MINIPAPSVASAGKGGVTRDLCPLRIFLHQSLARFLLLHRGGELVLCTSNGSFLIRCRHLSIFCRTALYVSMTSVTSPELHVEHLNQGYFPNLQFLGLSLGEGLEQFSRKGEACTLLSLHLKLMPFFQHLYVASEPRGSGEALRDNVEGVLGSFDILIHLSLRQIPALTPLIVGLFRPGWILSFPSILAYVAPHLVLCSSVIPSITPFSLLLDESSPHESQHTFRSPDRSAMAHAATGRHHFKSSKCAALSIRVRDPPLRA